jgi:hypothetical protein
LAAFLKYCLAVVLMSGLTLHEITFNLGLIPITLEKCTMSIILMPTKVFLQLPSVSQKKRSQLSDRRSNALVWLIYYFKRET